MKDYIPNDQYMIAKRFIEENLNTLLSLWDEVPQDFSRFQEVTGRIRTSEKSG